MGCISSKYFRKQGYIEAQWETSTVSTADTEHCFKDYNSPIARMTRKSHVHMYSTDEVYSKIKTLQSVASLPITSIDGIYASMKTLDSIESVSWNGALSGHKPNHSFGQKMTPLLLHEQWHPKTVPLSLHEHLQTKCDPSPLQEQWSTPGFIETVNVEDIMRGIDDDEESPHQLSSPSSSMRKSEGKNISNVSTSIEIPSKTQHWRSPKMTVSTSAQKLKLTLNLEFEDTLFAKASSDSASPAGSATAKSVTDLSADASSSPLFDPVLLDIYEKALQDMQQDLWMHDPEDLPNVKETVQDTVEMVQLCDPIKQFDEKCPPGGLERVVLYTTSLRGIRKTYEDCNTVREILRSFSITIDERDISMHSTFRNELRELLGMGIIVPRLFIKGRYIGGINEATRLHEEGKLCDLVRGIPKELGDGACDGCGGIRFLPCPECYGSCKLVDENNKILRCPDCNENGLVQCLVCL